MSAKPVTLYVLSDYRNAKQNYKAGDVIRDLDPAVADWLLADSAASFSKTAPKEPKPAKKVTKKPPKDKAQKPAKDKTVTK